MSGVLLLLLFNINNVFKYNKTAHKDLLWARGAFYQKPVSLSDKQKRVDAMSLMKITGKERETVRRAEEKIII